MVLCKPVEPLSCYLERTLAQSSNSSIAQRCHKVILLSKIIKGTQKKILGYMICYILWQPGLLLIVVRDHVLMRDPLFSMIGKKIAKTFSKV